MAAASVEAFAAVPEPERETDDMATTAPARPSAAPRPASGDDPDRIPVLGEGFVRLDEAMADDRSVVNSARVSFGVRKDELDEADRGLIRFLLRERHGTPYEHNAFRFHVRCPIFVAREWMRHRQGSFNELSGRYAEIPESFYVPAAADVRTQVGKPGAYRFEQVDDERAERTRDAIEDSYRAAYATYRRMLDDGIAREVARSVLPVGINTEFYWTVNARSLMNFLSLRNAETAQREIRRYAEAVEQLFATRMPLTHAAFVDGGRVAP
jgi:thymidylate synthase (FAD)